MNGNYSVSSDNTTQGPLTTLSSTPKTLATKTKRSKTTTQPSDKDNEEIDGNKDRVYDCEEKKHQHPKRRLKMNFKTSLQRVGQSIGNNKNYWDPDNVYVYFGGTVDWEDKRQVMTVRIHQSVTTIDNSAFCYCTKLSSIENLQTTNIETIGKNAFEGCLALTTVDLPKTIRHLGDACFRHCWKLKSISLPDASVKTIGNLTFAGCENLTTVDCSFQSQHGHGDKENFHYRNSTFPSSLIRVGGGSFNFCPKLENIISTNSVHYECDVNRGGIRYLIRDHKESHRVYLASLWPLILHRIMKEMELPTHRITSCKDDLSLYADNLSTRRASVVYFLLIHGVAGDLYG